MSLYKLFKTDENLEKEGIWIEYGEASNGKPLRIRIARAGGRNTKFAKALEKTTKPHRKALQTGTLDTKLADKLYKQVFVKHVVMDWVNVEDQAGNVLEFSEANVLKVLDDLPDLYNDLREEALSANLFKEDILEADLGNFGRSSATGSSKGQSNEK